MSMTFPNDSVQFPAKTDRINGEDPSPFGTRSDSAAGRPASRRSGELNPALEGELPEDGLAAYRDDGWHTVEVEPETVVVEVNRNGTEAAFETAVVNGHQDGAPKTQRSLFSWAGVHG